MNIEERNRLTYEAVSHLLKFHDAAIAYLRKVLFQQWSSIESNRF